VRLIGDRDWPMWAWDIAAIVLLVAAPVFFLRAAPSGLPPYGGDILVHVYPLLSLLSHGLRVGHPTLWNYYAAGGYPLAPYGALSFYPPVLLALLLLPVTSALAALYALFLAVLGVGTYLLAADLGQSRPARLLAAVTLAYGGFVAAHAYAGHIFEIGAICPMPLAFLLLRRAIRRRSLVTAIWCGAMVGLMVLAAGVQFLPFALAPLPLLVVWYTFVPHALFHPWFVKSHPFSPPPPMADWPLGCGRRSSAPPGESGGMSPPRLPPYRGAWGLTGMDPANNSPTLSAPPLPWIGRGGQGVRVYLWPLGALVVVALVALALSAVFVLPFAEILPYTLRAGAVPLKTAAAQSLPWRGLTMLVAPNSLGNAADGSYWPAGRSSPYFHEIYAYAGVAPLLLAPVALVHCRSARPYAALALLALLVMLGGNTPFYGLLYHLPGAGLVRVPARAGLILDFALAVLAGFGLDALCAAVPKVSWRRCALLAPGLAVALVALAALLAIAMRAGYGGDIPLAARTLALGGVARLAISLVVGLAACVVLVGIARRRSVASARGAWALVLPALALLDLFSSNGALLRPRDPAVYYSASRAGVLSPRDATYRVFAPAPGSAAPAIPLGLCMVTRACYDVQDAAPLALEEYWQFSHPSIVQRQHGRVATGRDTAIDVYPPFLRLFGVRTLYSATTLHVTGLQPAGFVTSTRWSVPGGVDWNTETSVAPSFVYDNPAALPRVFVASRAITAHSDGEALARVQAPQTDLGQVAVLSATPDRAAGPVGAVQQAWATWLAGDTDNSLTTRADGGTSGGYLVMDDGWFPGWTATMDGRVVPVLRADYLLRAVHLPPGRHTVRFVYAPLAYLLGAAVTLATALALLFVAAYSLTRRGRRRADAPRGGAA